jgi:hypothetical protein
MNHNGIVLFNHINKVKSKITRTCGYMVNHLVESIHGDKFDKINENNKSNYFNERIPELDNLLVEDERDYEGKSEL